MGKTTLSGEEQTLFESTEMGEYTGHVFLDKLEAGDTVEMRVYIRDEEDGEYKLWGRWVFDGPLECPVVSLPYVVAKVGIRVTMRQTSGTFKEVTHMWFRR